MSSRTTCSTGLAAFFLLAVVPAQGRESAVQADPGIGSLYGIAFNWGEPNSATFGSGLDDQYAVEAFYRWQISREIAFTPSVEFFKDPALNPEEDKIWMIGARLRIAL
jgi:Carbohydrate-selective porin, OprB family